MTLFPKSQGILPNPFLKTYQSIAYESLLRLAWGLGFLVRPFSKKINLMYRGRQSLIPRLQTAVQGWERPIWFHVASSGELEQCLPIADEMKRRWPQQKILITYFSATAQKAITLEKERRKKANVPYSWDFADFAPFDFKKEVTAFVQIVRPLALVMIHREVWPNLVNVCQDHQIACFLFATHFSEKTIRAWGWYQNSLQKLQWIGTTDSDSAKHLSHWLGVGRYENVGPRIEVIGDSRIDRVLVRKQWQPKPVWEDFFQQRPTWIAASLWPKDFKALKKSLQFVLNEHPQWRLVLVPHEPNDSFVNDISQWFKTQKNAVRLWSHWSRQPDDHSHLIVNAVGFLAELYRISHLTFVGGSFHKKVHNVLEPAAYGNPILCGPHIQNAREALDLQGKGLVSAETDDLLLREVKRLLTHPKEQEAAASATLQYFTSRLGASRRYCDVLEKNIPQLSRH